MFGTQRRDDAQKGLEGRMSDVLSLLKCHCPPLRPRAVASPPCALVSSSLPWGAGVLLPSRCGFSRIEVVSAAEGLPRCLTPVGTLRACVILIAVDLSSPFPFQRAAGSPTPSKGNGVYRRGHLARGGGELGAVSC